VREKPYPKQGNGEVPVLLHPDPRSILIAQCGYMCLAQERVY